MSKIILPFVNKKVKTYNGEEERIGVRVTDESTEFFRVLGKQLKEELMDKTFAEIKAKYGSEDVGTCIMGAGLVFRSLEPKKRKFTETHFLGQITQGSITNSAYFKAAKTRAIELHPELEGIISIDHGMMD